MKAILIIDIPDKYKFSDFQEVITDLWFKGKNSFIRNYSYMHRGVELRPLPKRRNPYEYPDTVSFEKAQWHANGYNQCLKDILGETE